VVGPNCQGVNYPYHGLCASWPLITRRGDIAIVSQSGTVGAALIDWASEERLGFSAFVSMGNRCDVDEADLISFFVEDPHTKVVALYIEGVRDASKFLAAVRACPKPVVIFKAGRTARGRKAAESHTRSLAGRDEVYDAVFRQNGIHRAATLEELYDFAKALAYVPPPKGPKTLIVTSSGGSAIIATDVAEEEGFRVTPLSPALSGKLREILPSHCIVGNPLDLTGDTDAARYRKVMEAAEGEYDVVMAIFGDPIPGASGVVRPGRCELVAYLGGAEVEREERVKFHEKKIAVFPTPERAMKALGCHARFHRDRFPLSVEEVELAAAPGAVKAMTPAESMDMLSAAGFPVTPFRRAGSEEEAVAAARAIGYPVAVKMNSLDVTHKSDVGGVILNVKDEAGARTAFRDLAAIAQRLLRLGHEVRVWNRTAEKTGPLAAAGAVILTDPELVRDLARRDELEAAAKEFDKLDRKVKGQLRGVEDGIAGPFVITGRWQKKTTTELPADLKKKYTTTDPKGSFRLEIVRLDSPPADPEERTA